MRTVNRNGVHIEQCDGCRGIFLDYGELESLSRIEVAPPPAAPPAYPPAAAYPAAPPPVAYPAQPGWGHHGHYPHRRGGLGRLLFSS